MVTFYTNIINLCSYNDTTNFSNVKNDFDIESLQPFYIFNISNYIPSIYLSFLVNLFYIISVIFLFLFFFKKSFNSLFSGISEKELNAFDDLIVFSVFLVTIYFSYIFYLWGFIVFNSYLNIFFFNYLFFLIFLIVVLVGFFINLGYYFIAFIKGASGSLALLIEALFDILNILSFNIRGFVQLLRLIIVYTSYLMLLELYYEQISISSLFSFELFNNLSISNFFFEFIHIFIEIAHTVILFFMQIVAFSFMVFWLFQFLITSMVSVFLED